MPEQAGKLAESAGHAALAAAERAGVRVDSASDASAAHQIARLFADIWATSTREPPVSAHLIRALAHTGNYVAGAWAGQRLLGASVGFLALEHHAISLHSHITGVWPDGQGSGVGSALKLHQRAWALQRGLSTIGWSFDPLIRRNAWFTLNRLRAVAEAYHPDFYGSMDDGINAGDLSDRCVVRWDLTAPAVTAACAGRRDSPVARVGREAVLLDEDRHGRPIATSASPTREKVWLCRIPPDIASVRRRDPALAREWRLALRATMGAAMAAGFVAANVTLDGCYVLNKA
jgi:predicted GNAT superfamily acetyltransferase